LRSDPEKIDHRLIPDRLAVFLPPEKYLRFLVSHRLQESITLSQIPPIHASNDLQSNSAEARVEGVLVKEARGLYPNFRLRGPRPGLVKRKESVARRGHRAIETDVLYHRDEQVVKGASCKPK
jgi:hypothetical protein